MSLFSLKKVPPFTFKKMSIFLLFGIIYELVHIYYNVNVGG